MGPVARLDVGKEAWDAFVSGCDQAWLWHRYDLQGALGLWPGRTDMSFALTDGGEVIALVPAQLVARRGPRWLGLHQIDSLGGPAITDVATTKRRADLLREIRAHLLHLAGTHRAFDVRVTLSPMAPAFRGDRCPRVSPLLGLGEPKMGFTWVVDLRGGVEAAWAQLEGRARTAIRRAERGGVTVRPAAASDLDAYYALHLETYRRTGATPHPRSYFAAIWNDFLREGLARGFIAERHGEVVAAQTFGIFKAAAIYWTGASRSAALDLGANNLVQWAAIEWMVSQGIEWCETGEAFPWSSDPKERGLSDFKKSFGGELYPIFRSVQKTDTKLPAVVLAAKDLVRDLRHPT